MVWEGHGGSVRALDHSHLGGLVGHHPRQQHTQVDGTILSTWVCDAGSWKASGPGEFLSSREKELCEPNPSSGFTGSVGLSWSRTFVPRSPNQADKSVTIRYLVAKDL